MDDLLVYPSDHPFLPKFGLFVGTNCFSAFFKRADKESLFCFLVSFPDICLLGPGSPIGRPFGGVLTSKDTCADLVFCLCDFAICYFLFFQYPKSSYIYLHHWHQTYG